MRLLLDTQVVLWWLNDGPQLNAKIRGIIADRRAELFVSVATLWEVAVEHRIGKLSESGAKLITELDAQGLPLLAIKAAHLAALETLPQYHRDPFDHLILAQAKAEGLTIVTADRLLERYGVPCVFTD